MTPKDYVVHCKNEAYDVYIGRPGPWGNPFSIGTDGNRDEVLDKFRNWLECQPALVAKVKAELRGKKLGCWCKPRACHGEILAEIANDL